MNKIIFHLLHMFYFRKMLQNNSYGDWRSNYNLLLRVSHFSFASYNYEFIIKPHELCHQNVIKLLTVCGDIFEIESFRLHVIRQILR
jgi:hypothetical protein